MTLVVIPALRDQQAVVGWLGNEPVLQIDAPRPPA